MKKKYFKGTSIYKILATMVLMILPLDILTVVVVGVSNRNQSELIESELYSSMEMSMKDLEREMDKVLRCEINLRFKNASVLKISDDDCTYEERRRAVTDFTGELEELLAAYEVDLVYFDFSSQDMFVAEGSPGIKRDDYISSIRKVESEKEKRYGTIWKFEEINETPVLIANSTWRGVSFGLLLNLDRALERFGYSEYDDSRVIFFTNVTNTLFSSNGKNFFEENGLEYSDIKKSKKYKLMESKTEIEDLKLVTVIPFAELEGNVPLLLRMLYYSVMILVIIGIPVLLLYVNKNMILPVRKLAKAMGKIEGGDFDYRIEEGDAAKEFELINRNFNEMIDQVQKLKIDVYERELEKQEIKMRYLSQQIQPHFILNALNILYSYEPDEFEKSQRMILCISKYLRYIVYVNAPFVTLDAEMEHIENYFEIQKARFPELFFSSLEYDKNYAKALIPPLMIQTLVENSIKNAIKIGNRISIYVITDTIEKENGKKLLRIRIADTGEGIPDEVLEEIQAFIETGHLQKHLGIGIQNTIDRLKYLYTEDTSIRFWKSEEYRGTNIEVILPVYMEDVR